MNERVVIVTGGGSGIGLSISQAFLEQGDKVVILQRSQASLEGSDWIQCDLNRLDQLEGVVAEVVERFGRIDVLINNAGVMTEASTQDTSLEDWQHAMDINATAPFLLIKHALPFLKSNQGAIINISSIEAQGSNPQHSAYCASKAALEGLTRAVAVDHGREGVRCNAIAPGWIDTEFNEAFIESQTNPTEFRAGLAGIHPTGRTGSPEDIAMLALWLASEDAGFVTGQVWTVDGGRTRQLSLP